STARGWTAGSQLAFSRASSRQPDYTSQCPQPYLAPGRHSRMGWRRFRLGTVGDRFESPYARPNIPRAHWQRLLSCAGRNLARSTLLVVVTCGLRTVVFGGDVSVRPPLPEVRAIEIPIKLYQGYLIVVEGRLGNLEHQHLLLDTGTSPSMIDTKISAKLGL